MGTSLVDEDSAYDTLFTVRGTPKSMISEKKFMTLVRKMFYLQIEMWVS